MKIGQQGNKPKKNLSNVGAQRAAHSRWFHTHRGLPQVAEIMHNPFFLQASAYYMRRAQITAGRDYWVADDNSIGDSADGRRDDDTGTQT